MSSALQAEQCLEDGQLVNNENRSVFEKIESHPFVYAKKAGKLITMSYWLVPEEIMEDKEKFYDLLEKSVVVSRNRGS